MGNTTVFPLLRGRIVNMRQVISRTITEMNKAARPVLKSLGIPNRWIRAYLRCLSFKRDGPMGVVMEFDPSKGTKQDRFFAWVVEGGVPDGGVDMKPWFKQRGPTNIPIIHTQKSVRSMTVDKAASLSAVVRTLTSLGPGQRAPAKMVQKLRPDQHRFDPLASVIRQQQSFLNASGAKRGRKGSTTGFRRLSPSPPENADGDTLRRWKASWYWKPKGYTGGGAKVMDKLQPIFTEVFKACLAKHLKGE